VISAAKNDVIEKAEKIVYNETLAYISCYRDNANTDALRSRSRRKILVRRRNCCVWSSRVN